MGTRATRQEPRISASAKIATVNTHLVHNSLAFYYDLEKTQVV